MAAAVDGMRMWQESKKVARCRTWTDWINHKDQQCKKSMWRVWLVAILKICIPRDLHCSIPTSTGERNELSTFPFDSCSSFSFLSLFFYLSVLLFAILDFSSWVQACIWSRWSPADPDALVIWITGQSWLGILGICGTMAQS